MTLNFDWPWPYKAILWRHYDVIVGFFTKSITSKMNVLYLRNNFAKFHAFRTMCTILPILDTVLSTNKFSKVARPGLHCMGPSKNYVTARWGRGSTILLHCYVYFEGGEGYFMKQLLNGRYAIWAVKEHHLVSLVFYWIINRKSIDEILCQ